MAGASRPKVKWEKAPPLLSTCRSSQRGTKTEPKKSILVVDDDKDILETLTDLLRLKGYEVDTAENAKDAMEKTKTRTFNLALLDIKLPDMEGTELLSKLHQMKPQMMKIMVTGYPTLQNAITSLNLGADAYVLKPVSPKELLKIVEEKLTEQSRVEMLSEDQVADWIKARLEKLK